MPEKIQFFPLDVTYKIIDEKAVIHLFGVTSDGKQICVLDSNFEPYFWVIPKKEKEIESKLKKVKKDESKVIRTEVHKKKFLGKEVKAIKVFAKQPKDVPVLRNEIKGWNSVESINEYDIKFSTRYLIDKKITPLTLIEAKGDFITSKLKVPAFNAERIEQFSEDTIEKPRFLALDIETYNPEGKNIDPEKNPIIMLSFYGKNLKKVITWKRFKTKEDYIEFVDGEAELIEKFKEIIEEFRPDILTGYYSDGFDLPYIETRAKKYKITLDIGLDYSNLNITRGRTTKARIRGLPHIDIFKFILKIQGRTMDTESYRLDKVAEEILGEKKKDVDLDNLADAWDKKINLEEFCKYNLHDSYLAYKLTEKMLPTIIELVKVVGQPPFDINRMGFSQLVEGYILKQAPNFNMISLNKPHYDEIGKRRMQSYKGAFVYEPLPGLYENMIVFDFRSLYPTIISSHNISLGTLNCSCCKDKAELAPVENERYWFCKKRKGFIPKIIQDLITRRMRITEIIKKEKEKNPLLEARQNSLKLLANSFYGYLGFYAARFYSIECARSITAWGRYYIKKVIDEAEKSGFKVRYSDTDSVFLTLDGRSLEDAKRFSEKINIKLPELMELEYEGFYPRGLFVFAKAGEYGAKKKYALLSEKGIIKIRGFEMVRRNWSFIAKETQEEVLRIILIENNPKKALKYVKKNIDDLRNNKIALDRVTIHTQLQKEITSYDARGPHVAVAEKMKRQGKQVRPGTVIKYIIVKGAEKIRDRANLPEEVKQKDYDPDYYINNQVVPAVERIFNVLGYKKEELLEAKEQSKLKKFF